MTTAANNVRRGWSVVSFIVSLWALLGDGT
jgi:hypothetical protein